jgi:NADH-quinone oxidoreductase subunit L
MLKLVWLIPLFPLLGFLINLTLGRWLRASERAISIVGCGTILLSLILTIGAFYDYARNYAPAHNDAPYLSGSQGGFPHSFIWVPGGLARQSLGRDSSALADFQIEWSYQIDQLSLVMMFIVTFVGFWIHVFATGYMSGDGGYPRFFAYLNLFMFMMLVLVMSSNFLMMFVGWEGVGLCSYLLIGYWFDRQEAADASKKAFVVNRIGDFGFALAVMGIFAAFGTLNFKQVAQLAAQYQVEPLWQFGLMSWLALGLFIGATGKSAQVPLYIWLPDAMAGPTPVSALIHAATMVTAGVFMVTRANFIFQRSATMMLVVALTGCLTAFVAATIGITQTDIKRVLAYSTVSQLGYMFLACGAGAFAAGMFHVFTHAFFKALLFLGAGSVIIALHHDQEMPRMGGLAKYMPATYKTMLAAWLSICGIIPFAGFWSKDEILWKVFSTDIFPAGGALWFVALGTAGLTAFYMTRLMALTFWGEERFRRGHHSGHDHKDPKESPPNMTVPLLVLAFFSTVAGFVGISPAFTGGKNLNLFEHWLEPVIDKVAVRGSAPHQVHPEEYLLIVLSLTVAALGIYLGRLFYVKRPELPKVWAERLRPLYQLSYNKWYWDYLLDVKGSELGKAASLAMWRVDAVVVDGGVNGSAWMARLWSAVSGWWDKWVIDLAVNGVAWMTRAGSLVFRTIQTGYWQNYAMIFALGLFAILILYERTAIVAALKSFFK